MRSQDDDDDGTLPSPNVVAASDRPVAFKIVSMNCALLPWWLFQKFNGRRESSSDQLRRLDGIIDMLLGAPPTTTTTPSTSNGDVLSADLPDVVCLQEVFLTKHVRHLQRRADALGWDMVGDPRDLKRQQKWYAYLGSGLVTLVRRRNRSGVTATEIGGCVYPWAKGNELLASKGCQWARLDPVAGWSMGLFEPGQWRAHPSYWIVNTHLQAGGTKPFVRKVLEPLLVPKAVRAMSIEQVRARQFVCAATEIPPATDPGTTTLLFLCGDLNMEVNQLNLPVLHGGTWIDPFDPEASPVQGTNRSGKRRIDHVLVRCPLQRGEGCAALDVKSRVMFKDLYYSDHRIVECDLL